LSLSDCRLTSELVATTELKLGDMMTHPPWRLTLPNHEAKGKPMAKNKAA
jgi:hypothetical protein